MIRTDRLTLRRARAADLTDPHKVMRQPGAMPDWSTPPPSGLATTPTALDRLLAVDRAGSVEVVREYQSRVIGTAGGGTLPEVGSSCIPGSRGKALAHEAAQAVIALAVANPANDHLIAGVAPGIAASVKLV